jgi:hypothetical protein
MPEDSFLPGQVSRLENGVVAQACSVRHVNVSRARAVTPPYRPGFTQVTEVIMGGSRPVGTWPGGRRDFLGQNDAARTDTPEGER